MASPTLSKAVAGVQTALIHFQAVAAGVPNRATWRLPQKSQILRVGASYRASDATDLQIMVEADGVNLLTGVIDMVQTQPTAPVGADPNIGGGINLGTHSWRVTFVTATGESAGSAKSNVLTLAAPLPCTAALAGLGAGNVNNGDHSYKVTFVSPAGESVASAKSNVVTTAAGDGQVALTDVPVGPAGTTDRNIYRTDAGDAAPWKLIGTIADNVTTTFADNIADGAGAAAPADTGAAAQVTIPVGPTGTVSRKVYRTDAGDGGNHKLVATVADNTTVLITDTLADGAGAAAPTADTRMEGEYSEGTLDTNAAAIDKETPITCDVDTLTGTDVKDLCVQIDFVRLD